MWLRRTALLQSWLGHGSFCLGVTLLLCPLGTWLKLSSLISSSAEWILRLKCVAPFILMLSLNFVLELDRTLSLQFTFISLCPYYAFISACFLPMSEFVLEVRNSSDISLHFRLLPFAFEQISEVFFPLQYQQWHSFILFLLYWIPSIAVKVFCLGFLCSNEGLVTMTWCQEVTLLFELTTKVSFSLCSSNGWQCGHPWHASLRTQPQPSQHFQLQSLFCPMAPRVPSPLPAPGNAQLPLLYLLPPCPVLLTTISISWVEFPLPSSSLYSLSLNKQCGKFLFVHTVTFISLQ